MGNLRNNRLLMKELEDLKAQKNFEIIGDVLTETPMVKFEFGFITFEVTKAVTNYKIPHKLAFQPLDVLSTRTSGTITFNFDLFTDKLLDITTTGAAKFRGLVGRYRENEE